MEKKQFIKQLDNTAEALYVLNLEYGNLLNEGLENRVDELMNLLEIQLKDLKAQVERVTS